MVIENGLFFDVGIVGVSVLATRTPCRNDVRGTGSGQPCGGGGPAVSFRNLTGVIAHE